MHPRTLFLLRPLASCSVARLVGLKKKTNTSVRENTLFHRESPVVRVLRKFTYFIWKTKKKKRTVCRYRPWCGIRIRWTFGHVLTHDFLTHSFVIESSELLLIVNVKAQLRSDRRIRMFNFIFNVFDWVAPLLGQTDFASATVPFMISSFSCFLFDYPTRETHTLSCHWVPQRF